MSIFRTNCILFFFSFQIGLSSLAQKLKMKPMMMAHKQLRMNTKSKTMINHNIKDAEDSLMKMTK